MRKNLSLLVKRVVILSMVLGFGVSFMLIASAEQSVEINAEISAKLAFNVSPGKLTLPVDPLKSPSTRQSLVFHVKTNAPYYNITAAHSTFEVKDYGLIDNGNLRVASDPIDGEGTGGWKTVKNDMELIKGETGRTNGEETSATYQLRVDYRVPFGEGETTVLFTAMAST